MTDAPSRLCDVCGKIVPGSFRYCPACSSVIHVEPTETERLRTALQVVLGTRFEVRERIGRGSLGILYRATDHVLERLVAIKVLRGDVPDPEIARARFLRGARMLGHLSHPHVIKIYGVDEAAPLAWVVMPLEDGDNLAAVMLREGRPPTRQAIRILAEVAEALEFVHDSGVVHRDVKPQHIMLVGRTRRALLTDFSLATIVPARGAVVGTAAYMSPEQAAGRPVDARSDLYSLGVVGYQLVTAILALVGYCALR